MALRNWTSGAEGLCTTDLLPTAVNKAEWRGYGVGRGGVEGPAYSSSGSSGVWNPALSRLCLRR